MSKIITFLILSFLISFTSQSQTTVDCNVGAVNENFCYASSATEEFTYVSSDGTSLNLTVNSGNVESGFDEFIVLDSDGSELYNGYGTGGDLSGLSFQSSGDTITVQVVADFSIDCVGSDTINPIDFTVSCATCTNPEVAFELVEDCANGPQFFVDADVTDLGSATDLDITDNQGNTPQTVSAAGVVSFGPYPNGTEVVLTASNNQDGNCQIVSSSFTQEFCTTNIVDCEAGPLGFNYCYENNENTTLTYQSSDGSSLNIDILGGFLESCCDDFIIQDSDGTELFNSGGDISGNSFQSTGDSLTVIIESDFSVNCQGNGYDPIDFNVSCATCANPQVAFELVEDCANGPQFFVEADVADLGTATDLDITDNQGNAPQTVSAAGVVSFGPYPNGTEVVLTVTNNQDANCQITSEVVTQEFCTTNIVDCEAGPLGFNYCYENNENTTLTYQSSDGSSLNIDILGGFLESCCDDFIIQDSDGTELFNSGGDISGNSFQSTGDSLTVIIESDFSVNCQGNGYDPIDFNVSCATCANPQVAFELVDDCINAPQFFVEADVADLGTATDLDITDNQGNAPQTVSAAGVVSFGPYPNGTEVVLTVANNQDANCQITSEVFTQDICTTTLVDCEAGPVNTTFCYDSGEDLEFTYVSSDGTPLNLVINSGGVENIFDEFIVIDTNGTELFNGYGNAGDLSGLSFQSSGDTITVLVTPDGIIDCQGSAGIDPIDLTVSCATCINPQVDYFVVGECTDEDNEGFFVDVEIQDLGDAPSLDVSNNQGDPIENITAPTTLTFGPYALGTGVVFTVENTEDVNCTLTSATLTLETCGCFGSDPFCAPDAGEALIFSNVDDSSGLEADPNLSNYGCLVTQPNPVWYFMQIEDSGDLVFEIVQNTEFDDNGNPVGEPLDVDFIAWGPFTDTEFCNDLGSCTECDDNTFDDNYPYGNVVDCSWDPGTTETFTIPNAQEGEIYAVLITNFDGAPGFISLGQVNSEDDGSGTTNCDIVLKNQVVACEGEDITLTATDLTADQYQWLILNENTEEFEPIEGETTDTITVTEPGTYQIFTLNGAEVSTEEFDVNLIPEAEVNLPEEVTLCEGQTDTLDATVLNADQYDSFEYQWFYNGEELTGEVQSTLNISETGVYSVEITTLTQNIDVDGNDLTCVNTYEVNVTGPIFSVSLGENQNICDAEVQTISAIIEGENQTNADFLWSTGETTPSIDVSDSGVYEVTVTIDDCPVSESVTYTFAEEPQFDLGGDQNLCEDEVTTLDATVSNAAAFTSVSYSWSNDNGIIDGETGSTLEVTTEGNYSVEVTTITTTIDGVDFNCSASDSIFVNITAFTVDLGADQTLCDAEPQTITAAIDGEDATAATYLWNTGETTQSIDVSDSGVYEVTVTINDCPVTASVEYVFNVSPIIALGPDSETCDLTEFTLDATPSNFIEGDVNYTWTLDGTVLNLDQNTAVINPDDFGFGTYEVSVFFDDPTCNTVDQITLSLRDDISVNITSDDIDNLFCVEEFVTFNASLQNAELVEADFQWFVNDGLLENENSSTLENYQITSTERNQSVRVEVTIGSACFVSDELSFNLYDIDNCVISQGLSPDTTPGQNDNLDLRFLDDRSGIASLEIFNRYGQRVYEKMNYRDEFFGQSDNGNMLETGTYFYVIKFENEDDVYGQVHKGWIYINREQ